MKGFKDFDIVIVLLILFGVIIYFISIGKIDVSKFKFLPQEFRDSINEAIKKKKEGEEKRKECLKLQKKVSKLKNVIIKKEKRYKRVFTLVRIIFVLLWLIYLLILHMLGYNDNLEDSLNLSEFMILFLLTIHFLTFGTISNLDKYIEGVRSRIHNWIFRDIDFIYDEINQNEKKLVVIENDLNSFKSEK